MRATKGVVATSDAWTPAQLDGGSGVAWWDFSDTATISDTGGLIDSVADKFSGGLDLTGTTTTRPTTGAATQNGLNVATFAADYLTAASAAPWKFLHDGTEALVMAVVKFGSSSNPNASYGLFGTNGATSGLVGASFQYDDRASVPRSDRGVGFISRGVGGAFAASAETEDLELQPSGAWAIVAVYLDANNATASRRLMFDLNRARRLATNTLTNAPSASNPTYAFQLGANGNGVLPLTGAIAEVVITTDWTDRNNIENYMVNRWALPYPYAFDVDQEVTVVAA